jgi:5-methylcytosine-specific restriction endonuclease McrA
MFTKEQLKQWRKDNPRYMEEYREKNKEHILEYRKKYRQEHREHILEYAKEYYYKNREEANKRNREWKKNNKKCISDCRKIWLKTEKGKASYQKDRIRRRTKGRNIINNLTQREWLDILEVYNYRCAYCDAEFEVENMPTKDHIIPISKGGHNTKENIVPACRSCNSKKHNMLIKNVKGSDYFEGSWRKSIRIRCD